MPSTSTLTPSPEDNDDDDDDDEELAIQPPKSPQGTNKPTNTTYSKKRKQSEQLDKMLAKFINRKPKETKPETELETYGRTLVHRLLGLEGLTRAMVQIRFDQLLFDAKWHPQKLQQQQPQQQQQQQQQPQQQQQWEQPQQKQYWPQQILPTQQQQPMPIQPAPAMPIQQNIQHPFDPMVRSFLPVAAPVAQIAPVSNIMAPNGNLTGANFLELL
jgi:hypothetical protein